MAFAGKKEVNYGWAADRTWISQDGYGSINLTLRGTPDFSVIIEVNDGQSLLSTHGVGTLVSIGTYFTAFTLKAGSAPTSIIITHNGRCIAAITASTLVGATFSDNNARILGDIL